jgi:hypothetical protein
VERTATHLLDLLELVDTEDAEDVAAAGASLFAEARRVAGVLERQLLGGLVEPLVRVQGRDGLLRRRDQVLLVVLAGSLDLNGIKAKSAQ